MKSTILLPLILASSAVAPVAPICRDCLGRVTSCADACFKTGGSFGGGGGIKSPVRKPSSDEQGQLTATSGKGKGKENDHEDENEKKNDHEDELEQWSQLV